jgi:hypothetical protein
MRYIFIAAFLLISTASIAQKHTPAAGYDVNKYFISHFHCKDEAVRYKGQLVFKFLVHEDGSITDCQLVKGIGNKCDQDALILMKYMPKWKSSNAEKVWCTQVIDVK